MISENNIYYRQKDGQLACLTYETCEVLNPSCHNKNNPTHLRANVDSSSVKGNNVAIGDLNFIIFPNPVTNQLRVEMFGDDFQDLKEVKYVIYSVSGTQVLKDIMEGRFKDINVEEIDLGMYYLNIRSKGSLGYKKFIKL